MSDLPLMAGLYDILGRRGVYYEVRVNRMDGVVAVGTSSESCCATIASHSSTVHLQIPSKFLTTIAAQLNVNY